MKAYSTKSLAFILICVLCVLLTSCARTITNNADELTMHTWQAELDNNSVIKLSFYDDNATMVLSYKNADDVKITGLCELSDNTFVIHDSASLSSYVFTYVLHYDCVDVTYADATVSLDKIS